MASEKRLIDANALKTAIRAESWKKIRMVQITLDFIDLIIGEQPTVDAVEVVHGRWEPWAIQPNGFVGSYRCTACGIANINDSNYCPNCGAKMDKNENP